MCDLGERVYRIKPEFYDQWGSSVDENTRITYPDLMDLARSWDVPISDLMDQVEEVEHIDFQPGELVIYQNGDRFEIGKIKRLVTDGAVVWYRDWRHAEKTSFSKLHKLANAHVILADSLGKRNYRKGDGIIG